MLRPPTSRFLLANFRRAHVRFPVTVIPRLLERSSRPYSNDAPPTESVPNSRLKYSTSTPPSSSAPVFNEAAGRIDDVPSRIRRWSESSTIALRHRADALVARLAVSFTRLGGEVNRVSGYNEIEELKRQVVSQGMSSSSFSPAPRGLLTCIEARISASRKAARDAKAAYEGAVQERSDSQREVNSLLERKSMWTDTDVSRFAALLRQERALEQEEAQAKTAVAQMEDEVEREFSALMRAILARYHEEQVWSDKIRSVSTYGQLAVLGVNVIVFVLAILLVEPWKRRRLTQAFERKVQELEAANLDTVTKGMATLQSRLEEQDKVLARLAEVSNMPFTPIWQEQERSAEKGRFPVLTFAGITLTSEDVKFIVTSTSACILAWAIRGWIRP
jgi:sensitive to high expression protein 9, mitochondrial